MNGNVQVIREDCYDFLRTFEDKFDSAISIGAFEHFASPKDYKQGRHIERYRDFFGLVHAKTNGNLGLQTIVSKRLLKDMRDDEKGRAIVMYMKIMRRVFPNSITPPVDAIFEACRTYYKVSICDVVSVNYSKTLLAWKQNLLTHSERFPAAKVRHFEEYLDTCVEHFNNESLGLAQLKLERL